jgi:hypothetical protein
MRGKSKRFLAVLVAIALFAVPAVAGAVGGLSGPLFGLQTARNGDLLVADASVGIEVISGNQLVGSVALPGATDVSAFNNVWWATTGAGESPQANTGQGLHRIVNGVATKVVDLFAFEEAANPDGNDPFDSNPYAVLALDKNKALVIDAGGNDLLQVNKAGKVKVIATFPDGLVSTDNIKSLAGCPESGADFCFLPDMMPAQAVPTSIALGPDGFYYVGELRGFPGPTNASSVWRINPNASWAECGASPDCVKVFDGGFTSIIDLDFHKGALYVAELDELSWAAVEIFGGGAGGTINKCNLNTLTCKVVAAEVPLITAITFDARGKLWATRNSLIPGAGEVFKVK